MLKFDLGAARSIWIEESETKKVHKADEKSEFLKYVDSGGRFADFHCLRHTFITNLARANISPKTAQSLARHSDIRLTMDIYTHIDRDQQAAALEALPKIEL